MILRLWIINAIIIAGESIDEIYTLLKHTITWMLRRPRAMGTVEEEVKYLSKGMTEISGLIRNFLPHYARNRIMTRQESFVAQGMPKALASEISGIRLLDATPDIEIGNRCKSKLKNIASVILVSDRRCVWIGCASNAGPCRRTIIGRPVL